VDVCGALYNIHVFVSPDLLYVRVVFLFFVFVFANKLIDFSESVVNFDGDEMNQ
jgi:hypothetical protein